MVITFDVNVSHVMLMLPMCCFHDVHDMVLIRYEACVLETDPKYSFYVINNSFSSYFHCVW